VNRRDFMKALGVAGLGAAGFRVGAEDDKKPGDAKPRGKDAAGDTAPVGSATAAEGTIERRELGRTGWKATILGFGGYPISEVGEKQAIETIEAALDAGVNYFDSASTYGPHRSEGYLGKVLPSRKRDGFFLTTKILERTRKKASKEFEESLRSFRLEPDLVQLHAINDMKTLDAVMGKGGSLEAALAAKEAGKVKFIGITGHTRPEVISKALDLHPFDTVLIPLGAPDHHLSSFEPVIEKAKEKGAAVIGMKVLSGGHAVGKMPLEPLFQYAWNLPIATAVIGARTKDEVATAVAAARAFRPLSEERVAAILAQAKPLGDAKILWWKRT